MTRGRPPPAAASTLTTTSDNQEVEENSDIHPRIGDNSEPQIRYKGREAAVGCHASSSSCSYWPSSPEAFYLFKPQAGTVAANNQHTSLIDSDTPYDYWAGRERFAQYLLGSRTWIGPSGQRPLLPKSEGDGYMLSAFVSRVFGFGRVMTKEELDQVNATRRAVGRNTYIDEQAAKEVFGTINKSDLKESPLVKYLYIGAGNEGYWNSFHMSVQFEDVVDCLKVLYPGFEFVFLFDHSQGHARKEAEH
ncbi:hypothetical protein MHU86_25404 [Fragilaria crotonensis]|nr:hypothetical protein MHU86_25404 [Fragilaria crotonensis]